MIEIFIERSCHNSFIVNFKDIASCRRVFSLIYNNFNRNITGKKKCSNDDMPSEV